MRGWSTIRASGSRSATRSSSWSVAGPLSIAVSLGAALAVNSQAAARSRRLPDCPVPAGGDDAGRRRGGVALPLPSAFRPRESAARRGRHRADRLARRPASGRCPRWSSWRSGRTSASTCWSSWPACRAIPERLYEAARLDGAGRWQQLRHVTLPMLAPTFVFVGVITTIGYLQLFAEPYVMTQGGPADATLSDRAPDVRGGLPLVEPGLRRRRRVRAVRDHPCRLGGAARPPTRAQEPADEAPRRGRGAARGRSASPLS